MALDPTRPSVTGKGYHLYFSSPPRSPSINQSIHPALPATMSTTTTTTSPPRVTADNVSTLFPDVDTSLAREVLPTAAASARDSNDLAGYDEEQIRLMDEVCIVLDEDDKPIGSASKKTCKFAFHRIGQREFLLTFDRPSHDKYRSRTPSPGLLRLPFRLE